MILEIDMGNTRLKWRVRDGSISLAQGAIDIGVSFESLNDQLLQYRGSIVRVWVASVVGDVLENRLAKWVFALLNLHPEFARSSAICGSVRNGYTDPSTLGVDRWLGLVAAYQCANKACVVVSCGTAITLDLVAEDGGHMGGYIAPGLKLMQASLTWGTRQIKADDEIALLDLSPGQSTVSAIHAASAAMLVGLVNNALQQLCDTNVPQDNIELILTGGDASKLLPFFSQARLIPELVLDGLACVLGNQ